MISGSSARLWLAGLLGPFHEASLRRVEAVLGLVRLLSNLPRFHKSIIKSETGRRWPRFGLSRKLTPRVDSRRQRRAGDDALPSWLGASLVEQVRKPLTSEAEPHLSGRIQNAIARFGDVNRVKPTPAKFAEAGDREHAGLGAFGLQPFPALATAIQAAPPLRDDASAPISRTASNNSLPRR